MVHILCMMGVMIDSPTYIYNDNMSIVTNLNKRESIPKKTLNSFCYHVIHEVIAMGETLVAHIPKRRTMPTCSQRCCMGRPDYFWQTRHYGTCTPVIIVRKSLAQGVANDWPHESYLWRIFRDLEDTEQMSQLLSCFCVMAWSMSEFGFFALLFISMFHHIDFIWIIMSCEDIKFSIFLKIPPVKIKWDGGANGQ